MVYRVTKKPGLGAFLVFIFGSFGFLYYSWKKFIIAFLLFFLPNILLYELGSILAESVRWSIQFIMSVYAYYDLSDESEVIEEFLVKCISLISYPIIILNLGGALIGGIWLMFLGEWKMVIGAYVLTLFVPYAFLIVSVIQFPLAYLMEYFIKRKKKLFGMTAGFISILLTYVFIVAYVFIVISYAIVYSANSGLNIIAVLLFAYGLSTSPFGYMASKEGPESYGSWFGVFASQIVYIILAIAYLLNYPEISLPIVMITVFGIIIMQMSLASEMWDFEEIASEYV